MKKLLLTFGAIASVVAPVTAVVACANKDGEVSADHTVQFNTSISDLGLKDLSTMSRSETSGLTKTGYPFNSVSQNQFITKFAPIYNGTGTTYRELLTNIDEVKITNNKISDVLGLDFYFKDHKGDLMISGMGFLAPFKLSKQNWDKFIATVHGGSYGIHPDGSFADKKMSLDTYFKTQFSSKSSDIDSFTSTDQYYDLLVSDEGSENVVAQGVYNQINTKAFYVDKHIELWANGGKINLDDKLTTKKVELTVKVVND